MFKKVMMTVTAVVFVFGTVGLSFAAEMGNERKGKYTYRKVYKACHEQGAAESPKPVLNPDEKTRGQWDRMFEKKDFEEFGCQAEWKQLSEKDIQDIHAYLHAHAADSPSPAKCR